jgi:hypothetical protein
MAMGLGSYAARQLAARLGFLNSATALRDQVKIAPPTEKQLDAIAHERYVRAVSFARDALMTGPLATPPRWSTIRRMMRVLAAGGPSTQGARIKIGDKWEHPTKHRVAWA